MRGRLVARRARVKIQAGSLRMELPRKTYLPNQSAGLSPIPIPGYTHEIINLSSNDLRGNALVVMVEAEQHGPRHYGSVSLGRVSVPGGPRLHLSDNTRGRRRKSHRGWSQSSRVADRLRCAP